MNRINISIDIPFQNYELYGDFDDIYDLLDESDFDDIADEAMDHSEEELFYMDQYMPDDSDDDEIFFHSEDDPYLEVFFLNRDDNFY